MRVDIDSVEIRASDHDKYSGCSQSVLLALQESFNIGNLESFKAATVLSGGVARSGETCGALIGGLMALGLVKGREEMKDTDTYVKAVNIAVDIRSRFMSELTKVFCFKHGLKSTLCRDIQERIYGRHFDLTDPDGLQTFLEAGGHSEEGCLKVCRIAARVTAEKISEIMSRGSLDY